MTSDSQIHAKLVVSVTIPFIAMLIFMPMYYTLHEQRLLLARIEYTRESDRFLIKKLRTDQDHRNMTKALLDPSAQPKDNSTRFLRLIFGEMSKLHLRKQDLNLHKYKKEEKKKKKTDPGEKR
jgi:hypothetical protein